jgi:hypothetical protein
VQSQVGPHTFINKPPKVNNSYSTGSPEIFILITTMADIDLTQIFLHLGSSTLEKYFEIGFWTSLLDLIMLILSLTVWMPVSISWSTMSCCIQNCCSKLAHYSALVAFIGMVLVVAAIVVVGCFYPNVNAMARKCYK